MEAAYMSTDRWMDKEVVVHKHNGILLRHKKELIWVSSAEVHEPIIQSEMSHKEKDKYHILTHILEEMMLKLKLQYFGHLMRRVDSLEKTDAGSDLG